MLIASKVDIHIVKKLEIIF